MSSRISFLGQGGLYSGLLFARICKLLSIMINNDSLAGVGNHTVDTSPGWNVTHIKYILLLLYDMELLSFRPDHPINVFSSMETIMTLMLEESEDISQELLI